MSDTAPSPLELPVLATEPCPYCGSVVPVAQFCGACGAHLAEIGMRAPQRLHAYAAFPDEPVLHVSAITSLFPNLSHRAKTPFRAGFSVFVLLLVAFALSGLSAGLVATSALGVPLLFLVYIWEVDPYEGSFVPPTIFSFLFGGGIGVGWAIIGGGYVDRALLPSVSGQLTSGTAIVAAVAVPVIGQLLMCAPLVALRAVQRGRVESLDGFVAGASGALGFTLAATIDLMAPLLTNGQLSHDPFLSNLTQVFLRGVTLPLISAMATGFVGAAYWARTGDRATAAKGVPLASPLTALVLALMVQVGLGFTDIDALSDPLLVVVHLAAVILLALGMRVGIHHVLLHESTEVHIGSPRVCANCAHLVPSMAFCPQCGVADRAVARPHRGSARLFPEEPPEGGVP